MVQKSSTPRTGNVVLWSELKFVFGTVYGNFREEQFRYFKAYGGIVS